MLTLTMLDIVDIKHAYKCLTAFGHRFRRKFGATAYWVAVPEFQKRGAVHFHVLIWGLPEEMSCLFSGYYVDKTGKKHAKHACPSDRNCERTTRVLFSLWQKGFVDVIKTDGSPRLATYLSKYMSKVFIDDRLSGKKAYTCSRNIKRPVVEKNPIMLMYTYGDLLNLPDLSTALLEKEKQYMTQWLGQADYKRYKLIQ